MLLPPFANAFVLTGPTGAGKSALALSLAERLNAEIVAMDSMTLYRGLDIGTAKPSLEDRQRVPHHLLDVLDPWESASVAWWLQQAADTVRAIESRGRCALFVGGTPLYLKALLEGLFDGPPADPVLRQHLSERAADEGSPVLHAELARVDPVAAGRLHVNDLRRIVRALEVWHLTGKPLSAWQTQWSRSPQEPRIPSDLPRILCLDLPRTELHLRINSRVEAMLAAGWLDEVRRLRTLPKPLSREAAQALGYRELMEHLDGKSDFRATVARIQARSRQFAKRQMTWFRHLSGLRMVTKELTFSLWGLKMEDQRDPGGSVYPGFPTTNRFRGR